MERVHGCFGPKDASPYTSYSFVRQLASFPRTIPCLAPRGAIVVDVLIVAVKTFHFAVAAATALLPLPPPLPLRTTPLRLLPSIQAGSGAGHSTQCSVPPRREPPSGAAANGHTTATRTRRGPTAGTSGDPMTGFMVADPHAIRRPGPQRSKLSTHSAIGLPTS